MTLAVMLTLAVGHGLVLAPEARGQDDKDILEGTWVNTVKIVNCDDRNIVFTTFQSMTTYMHGGTLIESGTPLGGAPDDPEVSRSAGHGLWERTGDSTYRAFFRIHSFDSAGRFIGITEVKTNPSLIDGDNPDTPEVEPYYLSGEGTNKITNLDPDNGTVINVTEGCNDATSRPILFED
jgi:hypothetical protein